MKHLISPISQMRKSMPREGQMLPKAKQLELGLGPMSKDKYLEFDFDLTARAA